MKKRLLILLLAAGLISAATVTAYSAETDHAYTGANIEAGVVAADYADVGSELEPDAELPESYSSLDEGYVTPVRSQRYNTCWAYSSTACTEILLSKLGYDVGSLSPMDMNYLMTTNGDGTGWQRSYSDAGYPYIALGYLTSYGAVAESDIPEEMQYNDYAELEKRPDPVCYVDSVIYLRGVDRDTVKTAVYKYGSAVGNFHYNSSFLNSATSAYYCDTVTIATSNLFGHAIAIVGWDNSYSAENFKEDHRPKSDGAWLCKNSWGSGWSNMEGYFWISYEDEHLFDKRFGPSYAISGVSPSTRFNEIHQNETYGATYEYEYPDKERKVGEMTFANVLDFSDGYDVIDKVIFENTSLGAEYELFLIPVDEDGVPSGDESTWTPLYSGTVELSGYICADIEDVRIAGDKAAIGVKLSSDNADEDVSIGVSEWLTVSSKYIFKPESKSGVSWLIGYNDEPVDVMDLYQTQDDDIGGAFVIKALSYTDRILGDVDGDGEVTILDATHIQRYLAGLKVFNKAQFAVGDYDGDGSVSIFDATRIQRMLAGFTS